MLEFLHLFQLLAAGLISSALTVAWISGSDVRHKTPREPPDRPIPMEHKHGGEDRDVQ